MSEETPEETTEKPPEQSFAELRAQKDELAAENAELRQFKVNETVRSVGLDPTKGNGAALKELLASDDSEEKAQELVAKFGWQAEEPSEKPEPTAAERVVQAGADKLSELNAVTTSDDPPSRDQQIAEAYAAGNTALARSLKNDLLANLARQAG